MLILGVVLIVIGAIAFFLMILSDSPYTSYLHGTIFNELKLWMRGLIMIISLLMIIGGVLCLVMF